VNKMKITAAGVVCAAALTGVGLVSHAPALAATSGDSVTVRHCQVLRTLPAYAYTYQGATATEPPGAARYRELVADGVNGHNLQAACRAQIGQQLDARGAPAPTLTVLTELRY
jgi:hypothetical protein